MPRRPLHPRQPTLYDLSERVCPKCGETKHWEPLAAGGEFYNVTRWRRVRQEGPEKFEKVIEPSGYCRICMDQARAESRYKAIAAEVIRSADDEPGNPDLWVNSTICSVCSTETRIAHTLLRPRTGFLCWPCWKIANEGVERVSDLMLKLITHIAR